MKDISFLKNGVIAHRGYHDKENKIYENTLKAFERAIKNNYIIELDVHLLKDGEIIVYHDDNLKRLTGINKKVKDCTLSEIKQYKIKGTENIPTLKEVLTLVDGKVPLIIELKYDNKVGLLEEKLVKYLDNYQGKFAIKSFHPMSVRWFYKHRENYIRGQLISLDGKVPYRILVYLFIMNIFTKPDFISCKYTLLNKRRIKRFRKKKPVLAWTIRCKDDYEKSLNKADTYICENIEKIL